MLRALEDRRILGIRLHVIVLALLAGVLVWNASLRVQLLLQHRTELGGVEHNVIHGIQKIMLGQDLYQDPELPPFDVMQYTPGYYLLCAGVGKMLGLQGDDARSIFLLSRSLALVLWCLTGWLVYRTGRAAGAAPWASLLATGITLCSSWEQSFSRMDALAEVTTIGAVLLFLRWMASGSERSLMLAGAVAVLGLFSKQSAMAVSIAPLLYLFITRQWNAVRTLLLSMGATVLCCAGVLLKLGTLDALYQNVVLGLRNGFSGMMYADLFDPATYKYFIGWHLLAAVVVIRAWRSTHGPLRFLSLVMSISLAIAMVTGLKYGSRLNYLHESLMLTFVSAAALLPRLEQKRWSSLFAWAFAGYGLLFAAFRTNSVLAWFRLGEPDEIHARHMTNDQAVRAVLVGDLGLKPDEYVFVTYREYLEHYLVGQSVLTQKDIVQYSKDRLYDYSAFHRAMTDGTVRFVITDGAKGPISCLDSTYAGWQPIREVNGRIILARAARP